ncbi:MAG: hypothetical protein WCA06_17035 [Terrimicrobiaceae bacterium]
MRTIESEASSSSFVAGSSSMAAAEGGVGTRLIAGTGADEAGEAGAKNGSLKVRMTCSAIRSASTS